MFGRTLAKYKEVETLFKLYLKILQNKKEWSASFYLYIFFNLICFIFMVVLKISTLMFEQNYKLFCTNSRKILCKEGLLPRLFGEPMEMQN